MLRSFEVANHKSFRHEQELQLMPARDKSRQAVPVAAVYGANASGKSNLLDAIRFARQAVRESFRFWEPGVGIPRTPYALEMNGRLEPSSYVTSILVGGVEYLYGFSLDDVRVLEEWLYSYPRKKKRIVFERVGTDITLGSTLSEAASRTELLQKLVHDNCLVLSTAAQVTVLPEAQPVYEWFRSGLRFTSPRGSMVDLIEAALKRHPHFLDLVRAADMGLSGIKVEAVAIPPGERQAAELASLQREAAKLNRIIARIEDDSSQESNLRSRRIRELRQALDVPRVRRELVFLHGAESLPMSAKDQSDGTLGWLRILPLCLDALAEGGTLVVDELDSSLHPRLIARLIELFRDGRTNSYGAQLLFTTHDATLLGTSFGREVLARDEIWFVEKDRENKSKLVALTDFHPRKEDNRERRYLGGSYGGVPAVFSDTLVMTMLEGRREASDAPA